MTPAKPSLELLRALTDEHVLRELMRTGRLTRAELATRTGLSKPTVSESVRRLAEAGLVVDTGERTPGGRGRGRVGSFYGLAGEVGTALVASIAPDGVTAEFVDAYGVTLARAARAIDRPARPERVADALRDAVAEAHHDAGGAVWLAVVSAADPVDRATGRLVQLPDAPFLLGELDPVTVLAPQVTGPIVVDNDVNWAARAERDATPPGLEDFSYVYLGEGMGCALVSDGTVRRGHAGIAGEIAHLVTVGAHGRATRLIDVFADLGLRRPGTTAVDVERLLAVATGPEPAATRLRTALSDAVAGVLAAIVALADPELVVLGGPWGGHPVMVEAISAAFAALPRHVPARAAAVTDEPSFTGARSDAITRLRASIVAAAHQAEAPPAG